MTTGERIRAARKKKGWTQSSLADRLGVTHVSIVQWENGTRNPKQDTLVRIADALDIDFTELMDENDREIYNGVFGTPEERLQKASKELQEIVRARVEEAESCGGIVTMERKRAWALEKLDSVAQKASVPTGQLKAVLGLDDNDASIVDDDLEQNVIQKVTDILSTMNPTGRIAVLRHAHELAQIPDYQKKKR